MERCEPNRRMRIRTACACKIGRRGAKNPIWTPKAPSSVALRLGAISGGFVALAAATIGRRSCFARLGSVSASSSRGCAVVYASIPSGSAAAKYSSRFISAFSMRAITSSMVARPAAARATINRPDLVLADEPTGSLDSRSAQMLLEALDDLNRELGATIMFVTHAPFAASSSPSWSGGRPAGSSSSTRSWACWPCGEGRAPMSAKRHARLFIAHGVSVTLSDLDLTVFTDRKWLEFILVQMLTDAVKYRRDDGVILCVEDNGKPTWGGSLRRALPGRMAGAMSSPPAWGSSWPGSSAGRWATALQSIRRRGATPGSPFTFRREGCWFQGARKPEHFAQVS